MKKLDNNKIRKSLRSGRKET